VKVKLSDAWLRALAPPEAGRIEVRDLGCPGLTLRVTAGGATTWSARGVLPDGRHGRVTLGAYPAVGLAEARKRAGASRAAIQTGADPVAEKRAQRAAAEARRRAPTVADRWAQWAEVAGRSAMRGRGWSDAHAARVQWMLDRVVAPKLGKRPLAETKRGDWTALVAEAHTRGPAAAGNFLRIAAAFLSHAEAAGWIAEPLLPRKASRLAPPVAARERTLSDAELARIWRGAETMAPKLRAFVRLLILTAARRAEVAGLALGEVAIEEALWRIAPARMKARRAHVVPLSPLALGELAAVWPNDAAERDGGFCLLGRNGSAPFSGFSKLKADLDKRSGVTGWGWHDLRRTARTGMAALGVPREHAEAALAHVSGRSGLVGVYDRHGYDAEGVAALFRWQERVAEIVKQAEAEAKAEAVVVPMRRRAVRA
jgi:integrase